ncbi:MAG: 16S rRNA (cytosine(967)-C(5))-methyltransferase RsmB [Gemmatimonadales bacterium]|nr:16S rRNA (cytosine(967)-C(5))-methyltransferase RsmB [Gemmatimonadales bacterium]
MLDRVRRGSDFEAACEQAFAELPDADRRLAHELAAGILRQSGALDQRLGPLVSGGWATVAPPLKDVLRLGAYQLTVLDRIPPHAAVSTSVTLAKELRGARASGFVNAVLRRLPLDERMPSPSMAPAEFATAYAHPPWLVERWVGRFGPEATRRLLEWNNHKPRLVLQPARRDLAEIRTQLDARNIECTAAPFEAGLSVEAGRPRELPGYDTGDFHIQDPAQALVLQFIDPRPDDLVFDACAAPGGKAIALGRVTRSVIAAEIQRDRLRRLLENVQRAGSGRERPILADAARPPVRPVDLAVLDAPCLATGTMARHPDARTRVSTRALERLTEIQRKLLTRVAGAVRPGGLLVYATCSLEPEENEQQVDRFLSEHTEFVRESSGSVPAVLLSPAGDLTILPHVHGMDGSYAARLRRDAA